MRRDFRSPAFAAAVVVDVVIVGDVHAVPTCRVVDCDHNIFPVTRTCRATTRPSSPSPYPARGNNNKNNPVFVLLPLPFRTIPYHPLPQTGAAAGRGVGAGVHRHRSVRARLLHIPGDAHGEGRVREAAAQVLVRRVCVFCGLLSGLLFAVV